MLSSLTPPRKAKVNLADYPSHRDIETRLMIAQLTVMEVDVLRDIVHHSLNISIEQLAEEMGIRIEQLLPILDKLSQTRLFKRKNMHLIVDKEMRKYFEIMMEKFENDFQPTLDFLHSILNQVPIHVLPLWYAIPRSSDNIMNSIIEKYFLTPKIYREYLNELEFDDPILKSIIQDVFQSPHFKVKTSELMAKYHLSQERMEEYLLLLEYHFICCSCYQKREDVWEEIVTPFAEWRDYLQFEFETKARPIQHPIEKDQHIEFQFIQDLVTVIKACQNKKISPKDVKKLHARHRTQEQALAHKLVQLEFVTYDSEHIGATEKGKKWASKPLFEQVTQLTNDPLNTLVKEDFSSLWNIRDVQLIEKSLRRLALYEWVEFEDFFRGFIAPIGEKESIILKNKGKKWRYALPVYTSEEKGFIQAVIFERLAELGIVETGYYKDAPCFCLTSFGYHFIH